MYQRTRSWLKTRAYEAITRAAGDTRGAVTLPVLLGPARGLRFRLDLLHRQEGAYFVGRYDPPILRRLAALCRPGWTIWDCGTYLGFYTAFFARLVGPSGHVVAIEPDPSNAKRTLENVALNNLQNVAMIDAAIGAPAGDIPFVLSDSSNSHLPGAWIGATRERYAAIESQVSSRIVRCASLDQLFVEHGIPAPDLVKLDIEGAEVMALQHTEQLILQARPIFLIELHNPECDDAAWRFGNTCGYIMTRADDGAAVQSRADVHGTLLCYPPERDITFGNPTP